MEKPGTSFHGKLTKLLILTDFAEVHERNCSKVESEFNFNEKEFCFLHCKAASLNEDIGSNNCSRLHLGI